MSRSSLLALVVLWPRRSEEVHTLCWLERYPAEPCVSVSGNIIRIPNKGAILLDAGEGTWGQMARMFGTDHSQPNNVWDVLRSLKCIFVSHPHGDHQTGVPLILAKRVAVSYAPTPHLSTNGH
jgi:ribonuclease BN (tRNA processing enzyme)